MIFLIVASLIAYCYLILILFSIRGWMKKNNSLPTKHSYPFCSVVIAARNEEKSIENTINSLLAQTYPNDCFEIIVTDDHSSDNTLQIISKIAERHENLIAISADEQTQGKKQALQLALRQAKGEFILFTDADCIINENWIETHIAFSTKHNGNLYFGNVIPAITNHSTIIEKCVALDFIGILGVQNGLATIGHPFSCNGANMCITKSFYKQAYDTNTLFSSGDDVFLLHKAKELNPKKVFFVPNQNASIQTFVPKNIPEFLRQRCRWASKATGYKDKDSIFVAAIVYIYCLAMTITAIAACFGNIQLFIAFTLLFLSKCVADIILFITTRKHYKSTKYIWLALPFECVYFLYITLIPILAKLRPVQWKNRMIEY